MLFKLAKVVSRSVRSYSCVHLIIKGLFFPCKSLHVFIYQLSLLSSVLCVYSETYFLNNIIPYESTN